MKRLVLFFTVIFIVTGFFTYASENSFKEVLKKKVYQKRNNREKREKMQKEMRYRKEMRKQKEEKGKRAKIIKKLRASGKTSYTFPEYRTRSRANGTISGIVTDTDTGNPIQNVDIYVYDESYNWIGGASSSNTGFYSISVASGNYKLECDLYDSKYKSEWYNDKSGFSSADIVTVADGGSVTADFQLEEGGYINVTVIDEDTLLPIENIWVNADGISWNYDYSDSSGVAYLKGLWSGDYRVGAGGNGYIWEYYEDKDWETADLVTVTEKNTVSITMYLKLGGIITGVVKDANLNTPINNIYIEIENEKRDHYYGCWTDADGTYSLDGLPTGKYYVKAKDDNYYYYGIQWYNNKESWNTADLVSVTAGNTTANIDFYLSEGGYIAGTVVATDTGLPIENADIDVYYDAQDWDSEITYGYTDSNGEYRITGLPNGNFYVNCEVRDENYIAEWYNNQYLANNANLVSVTKGNTTPNIDFSLETGGVIEGNVYYQNTSNPEANIFVIAFDKDTGEMISGGGDSDWAETNPGYYKILGLYAGNYKLFVVPNDKTRAFEWYQDKNSFADANIVSATEGNTTSNIDFILDDCGYISGKVLNGATPVENATVNSYINLGPYYGWLDLWLSDGTDASGNYSIPGLNTGQYKMQCESTLGELWYDNKSDSSTATLVSVTKPNTTTNINFNYGVISKWSISGTITDGANPISGVTINLTGDSTASTITDGSGNYAFNNLDAGSTYIITPTKVHWTFNPVNLTYVNLSNNITNADFTGTLDTWSISGTINDTGSNPISGVTVDLTGDSTASTITDGSGNYSFNNLDAGCTYTITPTKIHYTFTPVDRTYTDLSSDVTNSNFTGTLLNLWSISGLITDGVNPMVGVTVSLSGDSAASTITDSSGNYSFNNLPAGCTYTITPSKTNYTFTPVDRTYADLSSDVTNSDFTGTLNLWAISGTITDGVNPISDVTVGLSGDSTASTITDGSGNYSFTSLNAGSTYVITPTKKNYSFTPENITFVNLAGDEIQDFIGTKLFATDLSEVKVYPNPYKDEYGTDIITFANLTENAKIQIYSISGKLVIEAEADSIEYKWDLKNEDGKDIASGVYIYYISNDKGDRAVGKFVVIR